jgi:hypothetical protein
MLFVRSYGCHMPLLKVGLVDWSLSLFQVSIKTGLVTCGTCVVVHLSYMPLLFVKLIMLCYGLSSWNGTAMCLYVFNIFL